MIVWAMTHLAHPTKPGLASNHAMLTLIVSVTKGFLLADIHITQARVVSNNWIVTPHFAYDTIQMQEVLPQI